MYVQDLAARVRALESENALLRSQLLEYQHTNAGGSKIANVADNSSPSKTGHAEPMPTPSADALNLAALRQIKYELYCATVDLFGFSIYISPDRSCTVQSAYPDMPPMQFVFDRHARRYTDLVWEDHMEFAQPYQYWVVEQQCIPAFLAQVFLKLFERRGAPPPRRQRART